MSFNPGVELVLEAFDGYWRKAPSIKRLVFRSMPDETTRAAALKSGEVDIAYLLSGPTARGHQAHAGPPAGRAAARHLLARLPRPVGSEVAVGRPARAAGRQPRHRPPGAQPGRDARALAPDRQHRAARLRVRAAVRAARLRPGAGQEAPRRGRLSRTASTPASFTPFPPYNAHGRGDRRASCRRSGIRTRMRTMERAAFMTAWREKKLHGRGPDHQRRRRATRPRGSSRSSPRTAPSPTARCPRSTTSSAARPRELDRKKREALLHQIQQHPARAGDPGADLPPGLSHRRRARGWTTSWRPPSPASTCRRTRT